MLKKLFKKMEPLKDLNIVRIFKLEQLERRVILIFAIGLFIVVNILITPIALRWDLSYGKAYTLSKATKKTLSSVDKPVGVTFYVSNDLPTRLLPLKAEVTDLLNEYKKAGGSKVDLKFIDPKNNAKITEQVQQLGIPELKFSQVEQDKYAVTAAYFGIGLTYNEKKEALPQVTNVDNLEYDITSAIYRMTRKELSKVGIVGFPPVSDPQQDPIFSLRQLLGQQFLPEELSLTADETTKKIEIDSAYKMVLIFDDTVSEYSKEQVEAIHRYIKNKGSVIFFVDGVWVSDSLVGSAAKHNLFPLFEQYGISLQRNLVLSTSAELVNFGNSSVSFLTPYPYWIRTDVLNPEINYFSNITQLVFPWASTVTTKKQMDVELKELVKTTQKSWIQTKDFVLNPQQIPKPKETDLKQFITVVQAAKKNEGTLIVIPSSRFVQERFMGRNSENIELVLNAVNEMASSGELSGIRQRQVFFYPVPDLPEKQKDIFKYGNILLLPILFVLYGFWRMKQK